MVAEQEGVTAVAEAENTEMSMQVRQERSSLYVQSRKERKGQQLRRRQTRPASRLPCSIYILDLADIAAQHGLPACDLSMFVAEKYTQVLPHCCNPRPR